MRDLLMELHIAGGLVAIVAGSIAVTARKGGRLHALAGNGFFAAMLVLGLSAAILYRLKPEPESALPGLVVVYFVVTSWSAARRRDGRPGWIGIAGSAAALGLAAVILGGALAGTARPSPVGMGPVYAIGVLCGLAGLMDLNAIVRAPLSPVQRIARHLWRMCFAFFIATGSFFLGQQDVLPAALRGSPWLFVPAFAPFGVMVFWLVRIRFRSSPVRRGGPAGEAGRWRGWRGVSASPSTTPLRGAVPLPQGGGLEP